jgi:hypothetical protein
MSITTKTLSHGIQISTFQRGTAQKIPGRASLATGNEPPDGREDGVRGDEARTGADGRGRRNMYRFRLHYAQQLAVGRETMSR